MYKILQGDSLEVLRTLPDESVDCCVTSPPYWGLRDYGVDGQIGLEPTPDAFVARLVEVFREVRRVLKTDGTCWVNLGDSYAAQRNGSKMPAQTVAGGVGGHGEESAFRGMGETHFHRNAQAIGLKHKDLVGIPWRVAFALQSDGWWLRQDIIWHKPNPMPESVRDRCTKAHEYVFLLTKAERYFWDAEAMKEAGNKIGTLGHLQGGQGERAGTREGLRRVNVAAKRLDPDAKALDSFEVCGDGLYRQYRNRRSVWTLATQATPEAHFATFPLELPEMCLRAGCPVGGTVLDPFNGAGTTGLAALKNGRQYIGIELNPAYIEITHQRFQKHMPLLAMAGANHSAIA